MQGTNFTIFFTKRKQNRTEARENIGCSWDWCILLPYWCLKENSNLNHLYCGTLKYYSSVLNTCVCFLVERKKENKRYYSHKHILKGPQRPLCSYILLKKLTSPELCTFIQLRLISKEVQADITCLV